MAHIILPHENKTLLLLFKAVFAMFALTVCKEGNNTMSIKKCLTISILVKKHRFLCWFKSYVKKRHKSSLKKTIVKKYKEIWRI
jgi:hypothetical protein